MYRRKRYKKKRGKYRPSRYTPYRVYRSLNKKINDINKHNRPDMVILDDASLGNDIYTTGTITDVGYASSQEAWLHSVQLNGMLELDTDQAAETALARIIVFFDKKNTDPDNDSIGWTDVWKTETVYSLRASSGTTIEQYRYKIIFDKTYTLSKDADGYSRSKALVRFYKKFKKPVKQFDGSTGSGGHINKLYIAYIATSATTVMDFDYQLRSRLTKMSTA